MKHAVAALALLLTFPLAAATLEGYVYSSDGTPVDGAVITAFVPEGSREQLQRLEKRAARTPLRTTKTEAGRFAFAELPDSIIDVDVRADGFAPVVARALTGDAPLSITLHPVAMAEGRITAAGKPVADAYVVWTGENDAEYTATTDANGRYRAPDVRRWAREPMVFHASHATLKDSGRGAEGLDLELRPRRPEEPRPAGTAKLTGIVRLGDKPLAGVPLIIQGTGERFAPPVRVVTDAKGRYSATGLVPVRTYVGPAPGLEPRIRAHQGAQTETNAPASIELANDADVTLDVALFKAPMITGRVVDAEGNPVAGAQAQVILAGRSSLDFMHDAAARTTADGRYATAAPPFQPTESVTVAISARNRSTVRSKPFTLGNGDHRVDVTLPQFHNVTVRVVDRAGKPVPKALIAFADSEETAAFRDPRPLLVQPFVARAARADDAGEVQLQLAPGTYDLVAEADRYQIGFITARNITRPGAVDLTLEQAFAIRGRVHRNGVGVANANISVLGNEDGPRDRAIVTGADGRFEIGGLAREKYRLGVFKHDELIQRIVAAEAPGEVDVALPPAGTLRARVIDAATREPVREFIYSVEPLEAMEEQARTGRPLMERAEASPDGTFTVTVSSGAYRVSATATGYTASTPVEVRLTEREPTELQIALDRGATISGRITDESGTPIAEADVYVFGAEVDRMSKRSGPRVAPGNTRSAPDGTYSVSGVEPGTASMTVRKEGFVPFRKAIEASANTSVDVQLSRGLTLEGVVMRNGKPAGAVSVSASTAAVGGDHQPAITDADGRFVLRGLIAARYTVTAFREDVHTEVRDVDPTKEQELVISLDPKPAGVIYGTVTGIPQTLGGKIVRRAVFAQSDEQGAEGLIDENGNYRIENAPIGNVFVTAQLESTSGGRTSPRKSVNVVAGQQTRVDLDLGGGINVTGRVSYEGKAVPAVRVVFMNEASVGASATTRADGTYEVTLAAAGLYQIFAHAEAVAMRGFQAVREVRGGETIDIDIREQSIEGMVVDAETRQPIAGAIVTIAPDANVMESEAGESITMPNGRFQILTAAAGPHRVIASAPGYAHRAQPVVLGGRAMQQFTFELQRVGELRVRVYDAKTGTALEAHVVVSTPEGAYVPVRAQRSADGEWFVMSLAAGKYRITSNVHGYPQKVVDVTAPGSVEIGM